MNKLVFSILIFPFFLNAHLMTIEDYEYERTILFCEIYMASVLVQHALKLPEKREEILDDIKIHLDNSRKILLK